MTPSGSSVLRQEIGEQPHAMARFLERESGHISSLVESYRQGGIEWALIAARGSSDNAARYAQYTLGSLAGLTVALALPSLFTLYGAHPKLARGLVIGISQSGESPDVVSVLEEASRQGAATLAITNRDSSPLAGSAADVVVLDAGEERSVAATKTYTGTLAALALLSASWARRDDLVAELDRVPEAIASALEMEADAREASRGLADLRSCVVLGRGYNYSTAHELALKLQELCLVVAQPFSPADFAHGPVALVEEGFPVLAILGEGPGLEGFRGFLDELSDRGARTFVISSSEPPPRWDDRWLRSDVGLAEWLTPISNAVMAQLISFHTSLAKNLDPDHPRSLNKITKTT